MRLEDVEPREPPLRPPERGVTACAVAGEGSGTKGVRRHAPRLTAAVERDRREARGAGRGGRRCVACEPRRQRAYVRAQSRDGQRPGDDRGDDRSRDCRGECATRNPGLQARGGRDRNRAERNRRDGDGECVCAQRRGAAGQAVRQQAPVDRAQLESEQSGDGDKRQPHHGHARSSREPDLQDERRHDSRRGAPGLGQQENAEQRRDGQTAHRAEHYPVMARGPDSERQGDREQNCLGVVVADRPVEHPPVEPGGRGVTGGHAREDLDRLGRDRHEHAGEDEHATACRRKRGAEGERPAASRAWSSDDQTTCGTPPQVTDAAAHTPSATSAAAAPATARLTRRP